MIQLTTQQRISEDYAVPEDIASEALLLLRDMSQLNPHEDDDDNNEYALPVGADKLPDIVSEMNEERGIKTVINYDADIPEDMKVKPQTDEPGLDMQEEADKDNGSDETIIYDAGNLKMQIKQPKIKNKTIQGRRILKSLQRDT